MNKKITTVSMILLLTITAFGTIALANAQPPPGPDKKTYAFVGLIPNIVGVGQEVLVHMGINTPTGGPEWGWQGLTATVTRPDGTTFTLGPLTTDATGGTGTSFTPNQVGTYTVQTHFPEQEVPFNFFNLEGGQFYTAGTVFLASDSWVETLIVQEEPIEYYPGVPLPTEFWSRPVDQNAREWSSITGNWYERPPNEVAENNDPPETAHILWAKPYTVGGISGGDNSGGMEDGDAYEGKFQSSVILNGVLFYRSYGNGFGMSFGNEDAGTTAVDLRTGETLWRSTEFQVNFASHLYFNGINYHGVYDYLWATGGGQYNAYDPFTGEWAFGFENVPSGDRFWGPSGEILIAVLNRGQVAQNGTVLRDGWLALWNMTASGHQDQNMNSAGSWERLFHGEMLDGSHPDSYSWNVTIPAGLPAPNLSGFFGGNQIIDNELMVTAYLEPDRTSMRLYAIGIGPNNAGQIKFDRTWTTPSEWSEGQLVIHWTAATDYVDGGVWVCWAKEVRKHYGFSLDNGQYMWETVDPENYLQIYGWGAVEHSWHIAYDKLYTTGVSGILYCYDVFTGQLLWTYENEDIYSEYLFGNYWWNWISFISDGKIYMGHTEHSAIDPKPRGAPFVCLDAETGEEIWYAPHLFRSTRWGGRGLIGDGIMATMDTYDQRIYAVGRGPSKTTVDAPKHGVEFGTTVVVCGTVTDISAGTQSPEIAARFPNGVAAVSDESMSEWMTYVYKQFPMPLGTTGVRVTLDVVDANGNFRNIGSATTDSSGFYSLQWTPDIPGKYTVFATFEGTEGYYASYAETAFAVEEEVVPPPPPEQPIEPPTDTYVMAFGIAILAAVIIIGVVLIAMMRKK